MHPTSSQTVYPDLVTVCIVHQNLVPELGVTVAYQSSGGINMTQKGTKGFKC